MVYQVGALNDADEQEANRMLTACCGSPAWVAAVVAARPFGDSAEFFETADRVWRDLPPDEWRAAFAAHPRIGAQSAPSGVSGCSRTDTTDASARWSAQEQAGMRGADDEIRAELAAANDEYARRFGYIFIICATGRSAADMLRALRARMANDASDELRIAAEEQRKITRLRLEKMLERR